MSKRTHMRTHVFCLLRNWEIDLNNFKSTITAFNPKTEEKLVVKNSEKRANC